MLFYGILHTFSIILSILRITGRFFDLTGGLLLFSSQPVALHCVIHADFAPVFYEAHSQQEGSHGDGLVEVYHLVGT